MWATAIKWFITIIAIEAVTEIVIAGDIFYNLRDIIHRNSNKNRILKFLSDLLACGYCFSVWVSFLAAWALPEVHSNLIISIALKTFCLHRCSNIVHEFINRWLKRMPYLYHPVDSQLVFENEKELNMVNPLPAVSVNSKMDVINLVNKLKVQPCAHCHGNGQCACETCTTHTFCPTCGLLIMRTDKDVPCESSAGTTKGFEHLVQADKTLKKQTCLRCKGTGHTHNEMREMLLHGLQIIQNQQQLARMTEDDGEVTETFCWVDLLLRDRFSATREETNIVWTLPEGKYSYNIYTDILTEPCQTKI